MTTVVSPTAWEFAQALRRLYFVRFGFAIAWAVLLFVTRSDLNPASVALLVLYPAFDVAAAVVDVRSSPAPGPARELYVNIAISVLAGAGFIMAAGRDDPSLANLAGYAVLGGIFFLVSALRLGRAA